MNYSEPLHFLPAYQTYVWGGGRIAKQLKRKNAPAKTAESWEISDRSEGMSIVDQGINTGKSLKDLLSMMGENLVGKGRDFSKFPLLIKVIDAQEALSIQVHPNKQQGVAEPKTEAWVALAPSEVLSGFNSSVSQEAVDLAIHDQTLPSLLNKIDLKIGDAILIQGGTIHAILANSLILEVQQNSNTTYRLYDWGRVGNDGKARMLHLEEGLSVLNYQIQNKMPKKAILEQKSDDKDIYLLVDSPFFQIRRFVIHASSSLPLRQDSFLFLFVLEGDGELICDGFTNKLHKGLSLLIPACAKKCQIFGHITLLGVCLPQEQGRLVH